MVPFREMLRRSLGWVVGLWCLMGCSSIESEPRPDPTSRTLEQPIVGGVPDTTSKGVVALTELYKGEHQGFCSGALLMPNLVLTARHCVAAIIGDDNGIDCGETAFLPPYSFKTLHVTPQDDIAAGVDPELLYPTADVLVTPGKTVCANDLALLILKGEGIPPSVAQPYEPRLDTPVEKGETFWAAGYGIQDPRDTDSFVTYGERRRYDGATVFCEGPSCRGPLFGANEIAGNAPTCSGDSGGPAFDADDRVFGTLSRGDDQCSFAIYTSTYGWREFIRSGAQFAARLAGTTPPDWAAPFEEPNGGGAPSDAGSGAGGAGTDEKDGEARGGESGSPRPPHGSAPMVDPLGTSCDGDCPGAYACFTQTGDPPGICVPYCGPGLPECPSDYRCSERLGACVPQVRQRARDDSGCSISLRHGAAERSGTPRSAVGAALALALSLFGARRRAKSSGQRGTSSWISCL